MSHILKALSVVAGTSLAMGVTAGKTLVNPVDDSPASDPVGDGSNEVKDAELAAQQLPQDNAAPQLKASEPEVKQRLSVADPGDEFLILDPLLDRLERVEAKIESLTRHPEPASSPADQSAYAAMLSRLERRVEEGAAELALLRERLDEADRRVAESAASARRKAEDVHAELPALVENNVAARIGELRHRLGADIERTHERTLEAFEASIDEKISSRICAIDRELADQSGSIEGLRVRATETDNNLQRLVSAIEKLCERVQVTAPGPESPYSRSAAMPRRTQPETKLAFESQLDEAMEREPITPTIRTEEPVVKVQVPSGKGTKSPVVQKTSRFLFRNMIVIGTTLLASTRLLR